MLSTCSRPRILWGSIFVQRLLCLLFDKPRSGLWVDLLCFVKRLPLVMLLHVSNDHNATTQHVWETEEWRNGTANTQGLCIPCALLLSAHGSRPGKCPQHHAKQRPNIHGHNTTQQYLFTSRIMLQRPFSALPVSSAMEGRYVSSRDARGPRTLARKSTGHVHDVQQQRIQRALHHVQRHVPHKVKKL